MTQVARQEALAARWHLKGQDVAQILGPTGAAFWDKLLTPSDPAEILHQLEYRIEAGSAKKPNKALDQANMATAIQSLFQPLWQYAAQTGNVNPVNALISAWGKSIDLDVTQFLLPVPPPPPAPAQPGQPGQGPPQQQQGSGQSSPPGQNGQHKPAPPQGGQGPPVAPPQTVTAGS
jgi:hypothetical protein